MIQPPAHNGAANVPHASEKHVEVYLDACSIRGTLRPPHARVSDHLGTPEMVIQLNDSRVILRDGTVLATNTDAFVNTSEMLFAVDLTPSPTGHVASRIELDP